MSGLFPLVFISVLGYIVYGWISTYIKNENSPVVATKARLKSKKADLHTHTDANGIMTTNETLYLIYELDTGSEMKFTVNGRIYRNAPENEWGTITFQGTRFIKYKSNSVTLER